MDVLEKLDYAKLVVKSSGELGKLVGEALDEWWNAFH